GPRALARLLHPRARDREQGHACRAVVVGAAPGRVAVDIVSHAVVVLMRAVEHVLVAEPGVGSSDLADDVDGWSEERLDPEAEVDALAAGAERVEHGAVGEQDRYGPLRSDAASTAAATGSTTAAGSCCDRAVARRGGTVHVVRST